MTEFTIAKGNYHQNPAAKAEPTSMIFSVSYLYAALRGRFLPKCTFLCEAIHRSETPKSLMGLP